MGRKQLSAALSQGAESSGHLEQRYSWTSHTPRHWNLDIILFKTDIGGLMRLIAPPDPYVVLLYATASAIDEAVGPAANAQLTVQGSNTSVVL